MNVSIIIEMIGYLASILVVFSLLMTSVVKIRIVNSIGAGIYIIYGLLIQSYPTAFMNFCLVMINIYHLRQISKKEQK